MKDITVIIPIHEFNDEVKEYLSNAINSCRAQTSLPEKVMICHPSNMENMHNFEEYMKSQNGVDVFKTNNGSGFCEQINDAVKKCDTEWFTILEFDDVLNPTYIEDMDKYKKKYKALIYLPIIEQYDTNEKLLGYSNEILLSSYTETPGEPSIDDIKSYLEVSINGIMCNTHTFNIIGGLKESMNIAFQFEFLMRALQNGKQIFIVPKVIYSHINKRENSVSYNMPDNDIIEKSFKNALNEYLYTKERKIND